MQTTTPQVDLGQIGADIWAAMLGIELTPDHAADGYAQDERVVTGCVQITGDFEGAVTVQTSHRFAVRAAGLMFGMEEQEVGEEEVRDTVGELANMSGGNVKSLMPGSCQLSLPSVTTGRDYLVTIPGSRVTDRRTLDGDGELIVLTLLQRQP
jgi:chemotaxis protein CheX